MSATTPAASWRLSVLAVAFLLLSRRFFPVLPTLAETLLRRQDITFEDKDQALRDDVRMLGAMIGELLVEQGGQELFDFVENARLRAIRRREENEKPGEELATLVANLDAKFALSVIRAFSTYFQMVNTAEKVHRIRRRRDYLLEVGHYQPGGLEDSFIKLRPRANPQPRCRHCWIRCSSNRCSLRIPRSRPGARCCARNRTSSNTLSTC